MFGSLAVEEIWIGEGIVQNKIKRARRGNARANISALGCMKALLVSFSRSSGCQPSFRFSKLSNTE